MDDLRYLNELVFGVLMAIPKLTWKFALTFDAPAMDRYFDCREARVLILSSGLFVDGVVSLHSGPRVHYASIIIALVSFLSGISFYHSHYIMFDLLYFQLFFCGYTTEYLRTGVIFRPIRARLIYWIHKCVPCAQLAKLLSKFLCLDIISTDQLHSCQRSTIEGGIEHLVDEIDDDDSAKIQSKILELQKALMGLASQDSKFIQGDWFLTQPNVFKQLYHVSGYELKYIHVRLYIIEYIHRSLVKYGQLFETVPQNQSWQVVDIIKSLDRCRDNHIEMGDTRSHSHINPKVVQGTVATIDILSTSEPLSVIAHY